MEAIIISIIQKWSARILPSFFRSLFFFPFSFFLCCLVLFCAIITIVVCLKFEIFANLNGDFRRHFLNRTNLDELIRIHIKKKKNVIHICHHQRTMQKAMQLWKIPAFHRFVMYSIFKQLDQYKIDSDCSNFEFS